MGWGRGRGFALRFAIACLAPLAALALAAPAQAAPGSLTFLENHKNLVGGVSGIDAALDVTISPDGKNVYAVGSDSNTVAVFTRDTTTGALTFLEKEEQGVGGVTGLLTARGVAVAPDGNSVYVTGTSSNSVAAFSRDPMTGALTFVEAEFDGAGGVDGIAGAWAVAATNSSVYVTGNMDHAVATFTRDPMTGALTFLEQDKDGVSGVDGLFFSTGVAIAPDGTSVYATGCADNAVAVFSRNSGTGALTWLEQEKNGVGGVSGLNCARGVAVSPDGTSVYAVGESSDAVATFSRAPSGLLTWTAAAVDGTGGVDGLDGVRDVAVTPDGTGVYAGSTIDTRLRASPGAAPAR